MKSFIKCFICSRAKTITRCHKPSFVSLVHWQDVLGSQLRLCLIKEGRKITTVVLEFLIWNHSFFLLDNADWFIISVILSGRWHLCFQEITTAFSILIKHFSSLGVAFSFLTVLLFCLLYLWRLLFDIFFYIELLSSCILLLVTIWSYSLVSYDISGFRALLKLVIFSRLLMASRHSEISFLWI